MDASYLKALAIRCLSLSQNCFDLSAAEELRKLSAEFEAKAQALSEIAPSVFVSKKLARPEDGEQEI